MAENLTTYKVKLTEQNSYQVDQIAKPKNVKILMAKGEKGDQGEKGDPGTTDYTEMTNKPQINDVTLQGNKSFEDLGAETLSNIEIDNIINSIV